jgi:hypothetical protein
MGNHTLVFKSGKALCWRLVKQGRVEALWFFY